MKKILSIFIVISIFFNININVLANETNTKNEVKIRSILLSKTSLDIYVGETYTFTTIINPSNATDKTLIWESSNNNVVSVVDGKITAKKAGNVTITVYNKDKTAKGVCDVSVSIKDAPVDASEILVKNPPKTVTIGETRNIITEIKPRDVTDKTLIWESSDNEVITVDNGRINAKGEGTATITVYSSNKKVNSKFDVKVIPKKTGIESIDLDKTYILMHVDEEYEFNVKIVPENTNEELVWSNSNENVVSLDNGKVTALNTGVAAITLSNMDGTVKSRCSIRVVDKSEEIKDEPIDYSEDIRFFALILGISALVIFILIKVNKQ